MKDHAYFVIVDVDKIQDFIFESSWLKHIVGASVLIAYLTSRKFCTGSSILDTGKEEIEIGKLEGDRWMEVYFGGGNMKLLFADKLKAERFLRDYQLQFSKTVEAASFTSIIYRVDIRDQQKFEKCLRNAEMELNRLKQGKEKITSNYANPVFEDCPFCKKRNAEENVTIFEPETDKRENACRDCFKKDESRKEENLRTTFEDTLLAQFINHYKDKEKFMDDFNDLKKDEGEGAFLGIVTIDGNKFGEKIRTAVNKKVEKIDAGDRVNRYIRELNQFSRDIKEKTLAVLWITLNGFINELRGKKNKILFRPIIIGGDDICFVMDGRRVIPFTERLIKELEKEFSDYHLKFAAGVSIAKPNFPFFVAHQLSESLMKNVKKVNRDNSGIDFEVVFTSSVENLDQIRKNKYEYKMGSQTYVTTLRPYFFKNGKEKYRDFGTTLGIALGVENRQLLARNKIKQLRTLVRKGREVSEYEFRRMIGRMSGEERNRIWKRLGNIYPKRGEIWIDIDKRLHNNFIDLSELNEFYPDRKEGEANDN